MTTSRADYERRFRKAGLPLLIEGYSAREDLFTRAAPFLTVVFVLELVGAMDTDWPWWANLLALVGGGLGAGLVLVLLNLRGGRGALSLPRDIGVWELAFFVLVPAVLPLVFNGRLVNALLTAAGNLVLVGIVYLVVGYGLLASFLDVHRVVAELADSLRRLVRLLPPLLIFSLVLFVNTEMWQVCTSLPTAYAAALLIMFGALIVLFLWLRLPGEARALEAEAWQSSGIQRPRALSRRQRINLAALLGTSQLLQIVVVSAGVGVFFVIFGSLAIGPEVLAAWNVAPGPSWVLTRAEGYPWLISQAHIRVSVAIAAMTALYYSIAIFTDATYREDFLAGMRTELAGLFRDWARYLSVSAEPAEARAPGRPQD